MLLWRHSVPGGPGVGCPHCEMEWPAQGIAPRCPIHRYSNIGVRSASSPAPSKKNQKGKLATWEITCYKVKIFATRNTEKKWSSQNAFLCMADICARRPGVMSVLCHVPRMTPEALLTAPPSPHPHLASQPFVYSCTSLVFFKSLSLIIILSAHIEFSLSFWYFPQMHYF